MCIVVMVTLVETSADILAVGEIIGTKVDSKRLGNGLRADMLSSMIAPIFGSFTQSAFAQNVGLVAVTGIKSRFVVATGGLFLVILGLLPFMGRVIAAVPTSVLGGAGIVLFGTVAASGIRTLSKVDYRNNVNLIIVATSIGFGMIPSPRRTSTITSQLVRHHFPLRHQLLGDHGHRAEPDVQPPPATPTSSRCLPQGPSGCCVIRTWRRCAKGITSATASCMTAMARRFRWWSPTMDMESRGRCMRKVASMSDTFRE
jgi:hypothetical protein